MLRAAVLTGNIGGYGAIYDPMRAVEPSMKPASFDDSRAPARGSMPEETTANNLQKSSPAFLLKTTIWRWSQMDSEHVERLAISIRRARRSFYHGERSSCYSSPVQDGCVSLASDFAMQFVCHQLSVLPLLYAVEELTRVLFETSKSSQKSEETVLGAITQPAQIASALLIGKKCMLTTCYMTCHITRYICISQRIYFTSSLTSPSTACQAPALPRQQASQDVVERVLLLCFFQGFVLAEHEGYSRGFLGRTHGALAALELCRTAIVQIWPCYARSSSGIQKHDRLPYFLALCQSLWRPSIGR